MHFPWTFWKPLIQLLQSIGEWLEKNTRPVWAMKALAQIFKTHMKLLASCFSLAKLSLGDCSHLNQQMEALSLILSPLLFLQLCLSHKLRKKKKKHGPQTIRLRLTDSACLWWLPVAQTPGHAGEFPWADLSSHQEGKGTYREKLPTSFKIVFGLDKNVYKWWAIAEKLFTYFWNSRHEYICAFREQK